MRHHSPWEGDVAKRTGEDHRFVAARRDARCEHDPDAQEMASASCRFRRVRSGPPRVVTIFDYPSGEEFASISMGSDQRVHPGAVRIVGKRVAIPISCATLVAAAFAYPWPSRRAFCERLLNTCSYFYGWACPHLIIISTCDRALRTLENEPLEPSAPFFGSPPHHIT
jgi:hypothetical protein